MHFQHFFSETAFLFPLPCCMCEVPEIPEFPTKRRVSWLMFEDFYLKRLKAPWCVLVECVKWQHFWAWVLSNDSLFHSCRRTDNVNLTRLTVSEGTGKLAYNWPSYGSVKIYSCFYENIASCNHQKKMRNSIDESFVRHTSYANFCLVRTLLL